MRSRLIKIGNSRGVCLAKPMLEEAGLTDAVEIHVRGRSIVITPAAKVREGWAEHARLGALRGDDRLLDTPAPTKFDEEEWVWE